MTVVFWTALVLVVLLLIPAAISYAAYLPTGEPVPRERAIKLFRWAVVVVLGTFNIWVFKRVIEGIRALF